MVKNLLQRGTNLLLKRQNSILSAAMILMITYAVSMILGILRERVLVSHFYFCCRESLDAYYAAFRLPDMIFQLVVIGALSASFLPVFNEVLVKNEKLAYRFSSSVLNFLFLIYMIFAGVIFIFSKDISYLITGKFSSFQIDLMANLTRLMLFAQAFFLISNSLTAIIQSHQRFILPALAPLVYNLSIILSTVFFSSVLGIWAPAVGVVVGALLHLLIQIPLALRLGFSYQPVFDFNLKETKEVFRLMLPRTLALAVYQIEATFSLFVATSLSAGSLTIFHLAQKLMDLPVRLFGTSIGQASLPLLSQQRAKNETQLFRETLVSSLSEILYLAFPVTAVILILRIPLVRIAYGAKTFPWEATILTGKVVALFSLAIFSQSAIELLVRGFYALHNTRIPLLIGAFAVLVSISLSLLFVFKFGLGILGLAAATSISSFLQALFLFISLDRKIGEIISRENLIKWWKMVFSALLSSIILWGVMKILDLFILDTTKTLNLLALTLTTLSIGIFFYFSLTKILGLKEVDKFLAVLGKIDQWEKTSSLPTEVIESSSDSS